MSKERDEIMRRRQLMIAEYGSLFDELAEVLFHHDPIGIAFVDSSDVPDNPDEYEPEAETILPRLKHVQNVSDVTEVVYEEFEKWFGAGEESIGPKSDYEPIADDIWALWKRYQSNQAP